MRSFRKVPFLAMAFLLSSLAGEAFSQEKVILDDDFGSFSPTLIMLLHSKQVEVLGVTVVAGNSWMETETANVTSLMQRLGRRDVPIVPGAGEPLMGNRQPWYEHEERLFGNAEYLGAFSRPRPEALKPGKENAVDFIVRAPFKQQIVVPDDICEKVFYTKAIFDRIASAPDTTVVKMFRDRQGPMFQSDPKRQSFIWDELTAAILLKPEIVTKMEERYIDIDVNYGPNFGRSIGYHPSRRRSLSSPENFPAGTQKVKIVFDINRDAFWDLYVSLMTKPDVPAGK
ncbi:MAG: nucleoside hydrolase [Acidobacteria bacterium]|nr:nucleoside hydrolase [Acidobacteriota bacterium]